MKRLESRLRDLESLAELGSITGADRILNHARTEYRVVRDFLKTLPELTTLDILRD